MLRVISAFLLIISVTTYAEPVQDPTLIQDCQMGTFQTQRMPTERRSFWKMSEDYEIHDLKAEREYNRKLVEQITSCYKRAEISVLSTCNFNELRIDDRQLNQVVPSSEYYDWQVSMEQGQGLIYPAKLNYSKALADRIRSCFTKENLTRLNRDGFFQIYHTIETLAKMVDDHNRNLNLLPQGSSYRTCVACGSKDAEVTDYIKLNGLTVIENSDGDISVKW